ncbi:hypothetical protein CCZ01_01330 [Helicobacter monodelphidis]|uniref:LPP20 family lipoprotein n=1 Tax=Helicobacter sp. 15-1451 TaxID=2004995 RepID=UPI000DCEC888|nr:LPP20 family lipoprotein [Helicobacter sp. 15-1451]RAX58866.1 hypothetical protein CCZ01_01330 [Helicobacter sp. 15-1451]
MNQKIFLSLGLGCLLLIGGCSSKLENEAVNAALDGAPAWVLESSEMLSAVGSAPIKSNNINFAKTQASNAARVEIANQLSVQVESKYKELATSDATSVNQETVQAIRNSVNKTLAGSRIVNQWVSKDGSTLWVLVKVDKLDTKLLQNNLMQVAGVDKAAALELSKAVDAIIDGE